MQQKNDYCPFCSTPTTLYQLSDGSWACKDGSSQITCYSVWEKMLTNAPTFTMKDI